MGILNNVTERLAGTRGTEVTVVLGANAVNQAVDISPLTLITAFRVVSSTTSDIRGRQGGTTEGSVAIQPGVSRDGLAIDSLFLSSVSGGTVVIEFQGR